MQVDQHLPVYLEFVSAISAISGSLIGSKKLYIKITVDHPDRQVAGVVDASGKMRG